MVVRVVLIIVQYTVVGVFFLPAWGEKYTVNVRLSVFGCACDQTGHTGAGAQLIAHSSPPTPRNQ